MPIAHALILQGPIPPFPPGYVPHEVVSVAQSFFVTIAVIALGIPIIRAFTRRFVDRPTVAPSLSADVHDRLERIEQAVDTVAIEVERISESQRFLTKLMAEPRALPGAGSADPDVAARNKDRLR
jgi:hypothetical protein